MAETVRQYAKRTGRKVTVTYGSKRAQERRKKSKSRSKRRPTKSYVDKFGVIRKEGQTGFKQEDYVKAVRSGFKGKTGAPSVKFVPKKAPPKKTFSGVIGRGENRRFYTNLTEKELLSNKLDSKTSAVLDTSRTRVLQGRASARDIARVATGKKKADIKTIQELNKAIRGQEQKYAEIRRTVQRNLINAPRVTPQQVAEKPVLTFGELLRITGQKPQEARQWRFFTDSQGQVVGVQDPFKKQSYALPKPVSKPEMQRIFVGRQLEKEFIQKEREKVKLINRLEAQKRSVKPPVQPKAVMSPLKKESWKTNKGYDRFVQELEAVDSYLAQKQLQNRNNIAKGYLLELSRFFPGVVKGAANIYGLAANPLDTYNNVSRFFVELKKDPRKAGKAIVKAYKDAALENPAGFTGEIVGETLTLRGTGRAIKSTSVTRWVNKQKLIYGSPKAKRPAIRKILDAVEVQAKISRKGTTPKKVNFLDVAELSRGEAIILKKVLKETDSVVFGSKAARVMSNYQTKIPKDVDIATLSVKTFNKKFINSVPQKLRRNYVIRKEAIYRKGVKILDVKPLSRLKPDSFFGFGRGRLPIYQVKKIAGRKTLKLSQFDFPTEKFVKIEGIKFTTFSEQTTRKALGTLQVVLEKAPRRAKDPAALLESLKIQLKTLAKTKPKTKIGKLKKTRRTKVLRDTIKYMESKEFARLLNSQVPGLTRQYPLVAKINRVKLKKVTKVRKAAKKVPKKKVVKRKISRKKAAKKVVKKKKVKKVVKKKRIVKKKSKVPSKLRSKVPSKVPSKIPSKIPSKVPSKIPSKVPSRLRSKVPSRIPSKIPSKVPSKVPSKTPSKIPSKVPSKIPSKTPSKVPKKVPSKVPSRIPPKKKTKTPLIPRLTWDDRSKLPKGYTYKVQPFIKSRGRVRNLGKPTTQNRGLKRATQFADNKLVRSVEVRIVGITKAKDIGGTYTKKFRSKISADPKVLQLVEKQKYAFDKTGEKTSARRARVSKRRVAKRKAPKRKTTRKRRKK